jgi:transforming growth factor beta receptor III
VVIVAWPDSLHDGFDEEEYYDDDYSGSGHGRESVDDNGDEDVEMEHDYIQPFRVDFSCDYSNTAVIPQNVKYYLKLYSDIEYQREISNFPLDIDNQQTIYVEAGVTADESKQVMIQNCSLVPDDSSAHHPLIVKGCEVDKTVRWLDQIDGGKSSRQSQRFEFMFQKHWEGGNQMMLNCELTLCSRTVNAASDIPLCVMKTRFCIDSNIQRLSSSWRNVPNVVRTLGPLMLRLTNSVPNGNIVAPETTQPLEGTLPGRMASTVTARFVAAGSLLNEPCSSAVRVNGLETTAVICIAFAAFVIGILLAGALWYIHSRTGSPPRKTHHQCAAQHSLDTSGESTPCSNAPLAVHHVQRHDRHI